jgi:hypothetical protein
MLLPCPEGPARAAAAFIRVAIATRLNREPGRGLQLQKRSQLFIGVRNEALSIVAVSVSKFLTVE